MEEAAPQDEGMIFETKKRDPSNPACAFKFPKLPAPKKKNPVSRRVGIGAERRKYFSTVMVVDEKKAEKNEVIEEFVNMYGMDYDLPISESDQSSSSNCVVEDPVPSPAFHVEKSPVAPPKTSQIKKRQADCTITKTVTSSGKPPKMKRKLIFSEQELQRIKSREMLSDESINLAQQHLKNQFPALGGLVDTSLIKYHTKDITKGPSSKYAQIVNLGNKHWVCVSSSADQSSHTIYDSLVGASIPDELKWFIAKFANCQESRLQLTLASVQQQNDGVSCGVFAIAFATAIAHGIDPTDVEFEPFSMRNHLIKCLNAKKMELFPTTPKRVRKSKGERIYVALYCHCRMPYDEIKDKMVQCSSCNEWFHFKCEQINKKKNLSDTDWTCLKCK